MLIGALYRTSMKITPHYNNVTRLHVINHSKHCASNGIIGSTIFAQINASFSGVLSQHLWPSVFKGLTNAHCKTIAHAPYG